MDITPLSVPRWCTQTRDCSQYTTLKISMALNGYLYEATLATRLLSKDPSKLYLHCLPLRPLAAVPSFHLMPSVLLARELECVFEFFWDESARSFEFDLGDMY